MTKEKETLKNEYLIELLLKIKGSEVDNAKDFKTKLLECIEILDKIIELEEEENER